jgi:hypothetical protein
MRFLLLVVFTTRFYAQQVFVHIDKLQQLPDRVYDSLQNYSMVLLGEMHGTAEAPLLTKAFCDLYTSHGKKVILALEIPKEEQSYINQCLKTGDSTILAKSRFFREIKDGRTSTAMARLIVASSKKENVQVCCFVDNKKGISQREHDSLMAVNILQAKAKDPEAVIILLAGNIHTRTKQGFREGYETMGYHLAKASRNQLLSLNLRQLNGTAYNNTGKGATVNTFPTDVSHYKFYLEREAFLLIDPGFKELGYDGIIYLKQTTASLPFVRD